ncbi:magnesium transporter CorA family protein [Bacillus sp. T3]|uniref:magnesium transporter CorA family protein n=1 Tax=Bacillus sp. T3 TaxID=467262 RepID=UPI0029825A6E|nr:magnesium transporter CorA family protein [Bacillus sp. T3]
MLLYETKTKQIKNIDTFSMPKVDEVVWLHLTSSDQNSFIKQLPIHPLAKKNLLHYSDIPKINEYKNEVVLSICSMTSQFETLKINILVGSNYVVTMMEQDPINLYESILNIFHDDPEQMSHTGRILFHIINNSTEFIFSVIDEIADQILQLEKDVFKDPFENKIGKTAYRWKSKLHELRQIIEPQEAVLAIIGKEDFPFLDEESHFYFQDLDSDQARIIAALDTFKENLLSIYNLQMSLKADHTNAIMKTLTLASVIFLPMTFLAGLYGMNFQHMPELGWRYGYGVALGLMLTIGITIAMYFRIKGWWEKMN